MTENPLVANGLQIRRSDRANARWLGFAGASVLLGTFVLSLTSLHGPICLSRTLFHMPCPGCGLTRSFVSLWHGQVLLSLRYHPFGLPLFILCAAALVRGVLYSTESPKWTRLDRLMSGI